VGFTSRIRAQRARRREQVVPDPAPALTSDPAITTNSPPVNATAPPVAEPEVEVATTTTPEFDRAVPRGLQIAAAWSWRVILVVVVLWGIAWLARDLSEVFVPLAIAILLAAMLSPVANRLSDWGLPRGAATAITLLGGLALIAGRPDLDRHADRLAGI
jgi:hypothetical protein